MISIKKTLNDIIFPQTDDYFQNYFSHVIAAFSQMYIMYVTDENEGQKVLM